MDPILSPSLRMRPPAAQRASAPAMPSARCGLPRSARVAPEQARGSGGAGPLGARSEPSYFFYFLHEWSYIVMRFFW
jgi:hypothetical protein